MAIQTNIASGYLSAFEAPLGVSVMSKLSQWPFLQRLSYAGTLSYNNATFHGLNDFDTEMEMYSSTNGILENAWNVIRQIVPTNPQVTALIYDSTVLGPVGLDFQNLTGFGQAFAISPDQLAQPTGIPSLVSTASAQSAQLPFSTTGQ